MASRLVAQAKAGEVLLAASVYAGAATNVRADLFDRAAAARGRNGAVEVYRINLLQRYNGDRDPAHGRPGAPGATTLGVSDVPEAAQWQ